MVDFCGLAGPGDPGDPCKRWGAKPPTFWEGLPGPRGMPDPQKSTISGSGEGVVFYFFGGTAWCLGNELDRNRQLGAQLRQNRKFGALGEQILPGQPVRSPWGTNSDGIASLGQFG